MPVRAWVAFSVIGLAFVAMPASAERPRAPLTKRPLVATAGPHRTIVKFVDASRARLGPGDRLGSEAGVDLESTQRLLDGRGLSLRPVFDDSAAVERLTARALARTGRAQPDMLGMFEVDGASLEDARALQTLNVVEFVSRSPIATPPPLDIAPTTPDLTALQGYLGPDPGVDAIGAWAMGHRGANVRLADVEYAWFVDHEEWNEGTLIAEPNQTPFLDALEGITDGNHGTAVAGVLIAGDNGYGVTGIAPDSTLGVYPEFTIESGARRPEAIIAAAADGDVGDVILLEMQVGENTTGELGPAELDESVWVATRMVTDAGAVVVAAAGNGDLDLDRDELAYYRDRGDSGAIVVGAGRPGTRERLGFSTHGERIDVQGWGQDVFTTGYGQYAIYGDDPNQAYTSAFNGTSSASPTVAGVAALVQDAVKASGGTPLTSQQMRAVLRGTGLPQPAGDSGQIGPLPQAPAAIAAALLPTTEPPTLTITSPAPTQTEASTFTTTIDVAASGDTAFVQLSINGELQPLVDEVPPFSFAEVVFPVGTWEVAALGSSIWDLEGSSDPITIEVGYTPPDTTTGEDGSSGGIGGGTAAETSMTDGGTTGLPTDPGASTDDPIGSSSGDSAGASGGSGGCRSGGDGPPPWVLLFVALWPTARTRGRASRR